MTATKTCAYRLLEMIHLLYRQSWTQMYGGSIFWLNKRYAWKYI